MSDQDDFQEIRTQFGRVASKYSDLVTEVTDVLRRSLKTNQIMAASISGRPKTIDSFLEKISRKRYQNPFVETTDLAGARIVCTYDSELFEIEKLIEGLFDVHERIDKSGELGVDKMGYGGKAYVVSLGSRYKGGRSEGLTDLKCEIQVRTILQDASAIIEHQLVYKKEDQIPSSLQRDINNVASLLEIAQGVFDNVREKREAYIEEIQKKKANSSTFLDQPVDYDTLLAYTQWKFPSLPVSEATTQLILRDIDRKDYPTLQKIDDVVNRTRAAVDAYSKENPDWFKFGTDYVTKSLGFYDPMFRAKHGFASRTRIAFEKFKGLIGK